MSPRIRVEGLKGQSRVGRLAIEGLWYFCYGKSIVKVEQCLRGLGAAWVL